MSRADPPPITTTTHPDPHTSLLFVVSCIARGFRSGRQTDPGLPRGAAIVDSRGKRFLVITDTSGAEHLRAIWVAYAPTYAVVVEPGLYEAAAWVRHVLAADDPIAAATAVPSPAPVL